MILSRSLLSYRVHGSQHVNNAKHKRHRGLPKTLPFFFRSMKQVWKRKTLQHAKSCNARFKLFFFLRGVVSLFVAAYSSLLSWFLFSSYSVYFLSQIKIKCGKRRKETKKKGGKTLANMFRGKVVTLLLLAFCYGSRRTHTWARKRKTVSYKTRAVLVQFVVSFCFFLQLV